MLQRRAISPGLRAQLGQQLLAGNSRETGIVVAVGDERGTARAAVDEHDVAAKTREVDGRGQAGRAATDDEAIDLWSAGNHGALASPGRPGHNGEVGPRFARRRHSGKKKT